MSSIKSVFGLPQDINKNEKAKELKQVGKKVADIKKGKGGESAKTSDVAQISSAGKELLSLKLQAEQYVDQVKNSETLTVSEIEAIKEKIASNFYFDPEVIDKIVDKIVSLPNFHRIDE